MTIFKQWNFFSKLDMVNAYLFCSRQVDDDLSIIFVSFDVLERHQVVNLLLDHLRLGAEQADVSHDIGHQETDLVGLLCLHYLHYLSLNLILAPINDLLHLSSFLHSRLQCLALGDLGWYQVVPDGIRLEVRIGLDLLLLAKGHFSSLLLG